MEIEDKENLVDVKSLDNLIFGKMSGLNHTFRFSGQKKIRNQSVAEHSYWTAIIAVALARYENMMRKKQQEILSPLNIELLYDLCIFHDVDEVITGDLNHRFKHSEEGEDFRREFSKLIDLVVPKILFRILSGADVETSWKLSHNKNDEYNYLLKMGDWLQLLQYAVEEVELGNKKFMSKVIRVIGLIKNKNISERYITQARLFFVPKLIDDYLDYFIKVKVKILKGEKNEE